MKKKLTNKKQIEVAKQSSLIPETITYKGIAYKVRSNKLGVGERINTLISPLKDDLLLEPYWILRIPEAAEYSAIKNSIAQISLSISEMQSDLNSKETHPQRKKEIEKTISKAKGDLIQAKAGLSKPQMERIQWRITEQENDVYSKFIDDLDNFKEAVSILLLGDVTPIIEDINKIPEHGAGKEIIELRDQVFKVFFSLTGMMNKLLMILSSLIGV